MAQKGQIISIARVGSLDQDTYSWRAVAGTGATDLTTENYVGLAAAAANDNATATVDVSGATNTSQSSLTPGQKYFVQGDGTIGLTADTPKVYAGTAISATKLIVNDAPEPYVASGWTVLNKGTISNASNATISDSLSSDYALYRVQFYLKYSSVGAEGGIQIKTGGNWEESNYFYEMFTGRHDNEIAYAYSSQSKIFFGGGAGLQVANGVMEFANVADTSHIKIFRISVSANTALTSFSANHYVDTICGGHDSSTAITGVRLAGDTMTAGWFVLEGLKI